MLPAAWNSDDSWWKMPVSKYTASSSPTRTGRAIIATPGSTVAARRIFDAVGRATSLALRQT